MTDDHNQNAEARPDLLGYHLGLDDAAERARIEGEFDTPRELRRACEQLDTLLAPLDSDPIEPMPENLVQKVLDGVRAATQPLPLPKPAADPVTHEGYGAGAGPLVTMREVAGIAAAILIFVGIFIPGYQTARSEAQKIACANNLRSLGDAYARYMEANGGFLPYTGSAGGRTGWYHPDSRGRPGPRNSRHAYRLVRDRFIAPNRFVCQGSDGDIPMENQDLDSYDDFPDPRNISYATRFDMVPFRRSTLLPAAPIAACMTPLVDPNRFLIRGPGIALNSPNHHGGQNVLRAKIRVSFHTSPKVGVDNDDIYRVRNVFEYHGDERPATPDDTFLVP